MAEEHKGRRKWSAQFKAELAEQLLRGKATVEGLSSRHRIHPSLLHRWRQEFLARGADLSGQQRQQELAAENRKLRLDKEKQERVVDFLAAALGKDTAGPSAR